MKRISHSLSVARIPAAVLGVLAVSFVGHGPTEFDHWSADLQTAYLSQHAKTQDQRIALVEISEQSLDGYPYLSPINRGYLTRLLKTIDRAGPKAIGIDLLFDRASEPDKDREWIDAVQKANAPVVLSVVDDASLSTDGRAFQSRFLATGRPAGHPYFEGHASRILVSGGVVRAIAGPSAEGGQRKSFADAVVDAISKPYHVHGPISWLLPPRDAEKSDTFWSVPSERILADDEVAARLSQQLHDKVVLIGGNFSDRDKHLTPLYLRTGTRMSGVEIHAQAIAQRLDQRPIHEVGLGWHLLLLLLFLILGYWIVGRSRWRHFHLTTELVSVVGIVAIAALVFTIGNIIFPFATTLLAWTVGAAIGRAAHENTDGQQPSGAAEPAVGS